MSVLVVIMLYMSISCDLVIGITLPRGIIDSPFTESNACDRLLSAGNGMKQRNMQ